MPTTTGTKSVRASDIHVYPSPVKDYLNIDLHEGVIQDVKLFDLFGNLIISDKIGKTLDLSNVVSGMYILVMTELKTNKRISKRIIKI